MFFELGQELAHHFVVMLLKSQQFGKPLNEKTMHGVFGMDHEPMQGPKRVFLVVQVHQEQGSDLRHS